MEQDSHALIDPMLCVRLKRPKRSTSSLCWQNWRRPFTAPSLSGKEVGSSLPPEETFSGLGAAAECRGRHFGTTASRGAAGFRIGLLVMTEDSSLRLQSMQVYGK